MSGSSTSGESDSFDGRKRWRAESESRKPALAEEGLRTEKGDPRAEVGSSNGSHGATLRVRLGSPSIIFFVLEFRRGERVEMRERKEGESVIYKLFWGRQRERECQVGHIVT